MRAKRPYPRRKQPVPQPKDKISSLPKILTNSAIILAVITAALYFHGRNYIEGYYFYWGLSTDLFPVTTEDAFFYAGLFYLAFGMENWIYLAWMAGCVLSLYLALFLLCSEKPFRVIQKIAKSKALNSPQKVVFVGFVENIDRFLTAALVVLAFVLMSSFAFQKGKGMAEVQHQNMLADKPISKSKFGKVSLTFLDEKGQGMSLSGYRLATSSSFCALFAENEKAVRVFPLARVISMNISERVKGKGGK